MRNKSYLRYIGVLLTFAVMFVLSVFLYPLIVYPLRKQIRANNNVLTRFLWLFLNDTTPINDKDIDSGDYGRYSHDFIGAIRQSVLRNNSWNMRITYFAIRKGKKINKSGFGSRLYNNNVPLLLGATDMVYQIEGGEEWYFRKSTTAELKNWFFGYTHYTYQFGATNSRYVSKFNLIKNK